MKEVLRCFCWWQLAVDPEIHHAVGHGPQVMFPANIHAAGEGLATSTGDNLLPRTAMQVVLLTAALAIAVDHVRSRRRSRERPA